MDLSNASKLADFCSGIGTQGTILKIDDTNQRIGIGTNDPQANLQVGTGVTVYGNSGIISATAFYGSGENLTGVAVTDNVVTNTLKVLGVSTFVGDVSIGGTLTYGDVTNVDSVGLITARTGVKVTAGGINAVGVVTATSFSGDGSNLDGVESGVENFVASGTIDNGKTVVLNTDGTVGIVTQTISSTPTVGDPVLFESGITAETSVAYVGSDKVVISYCDDGNNGYGTAVVGIVSGDSITFSDPVIFKYDNVGGSGVIAVYDSTNDRVVISYRDGGQSSYPTASVGQVIGTGITFGPSNAWAIDTFEKGSATFDSTNGKVVIVWRSGNNPNEGRAVVGTVDPSNNTIGFGNTGFAFNSYYTGPTSTTYDSTNQRVVIVHQDAQQGGAGKVVVGTVTGVGITFGDPVEFESSTIDDISATFDSTNGKVVFVYRNDGNNWYGTARVGTVSGDTITFGSEVVYNYANSPWNSVVYDSVNERVVIAYTDSGNSNHGTAIVGTVVGTAITFPGSEVVFESDHANDIGSGYDSTTQKVVIAYKDDDNSDYGTAVVFSAIPKTTNLTAENYIGIAGEDIANAATGKINTIGGVNSGQSGLTTAQTYYVAQTGILTTTADTPSVVAGTSISSTEILIR